MFLGFWSWVLVLIAVIAIFSADRLPELKEFLKEFTETVKNGTKNGVQKVKEKAEKSKKNRNNK